MRHRQRLGLAGLFILIIALLIPPTVGPLIGVVTLGVAGICAYVFVDPGRP